MTGATNYPRVSACRGVSRGVPQQRIVDPAVDLDAFPEALRALAISALARDADLVHAGQPRRRLDLRDGRAELASKRRERHQQVGLESDREQPVDLVQVARRLAENAERAYRERE